MVNIVKQAIIQKMKAIRYSLDKLAIERAELRHEYMELNRALGKIEFNEIVAKYTAKVESNGE